MAKKIIEKIKCSCCSKEKYATRDFYKSASELNADTERLNICKECVQNRYERLLTIYNGNSTNAFRHLLMNLDEYFDEELYNSCVVKGGINFIGDYFRQVNGTKDRRDKTSLNNSLDSTESKDIVLKDGVISEELVIKWGRGRKKEDYLLLEKRYKKKIEDYPSKKPAERAIIRSICLLELDIEEARLNDKKSVSSLEKVMSEKFKQLGINPSDDKMYDEQSMLIFGVIMGILENDYPVFDTQDRYKDVDNMHWYWYRNVIVPTLKAWDMANGDYSLEDGINNIEVLPEIKSVMEDYKDGR